MTMIQFKLTFADENGIYSHEEHIEGERGHLLAYLQGYLKSSNYMLMRIEGMGTVVELSE